MGKTELVVAACRFLSHAKGCFLVRDQLTGMKDAEITPNAVLVLDDVWPASFAKEWGYATKSQPQQITLAHLPFVVLQVFIL